MGRSHRRMMGVAVGALLVAPALALINGSVARADESDLVTLGPYLIGGYTDTLTYASQGLAFDNYIVGSSNSLPFDFDVYQGPMGSNSAEYIFTIPLLFQVGFQDVDGMTSSFYSFNPFEFVSPDAGLITLGGAGAPVEGIVTIGPLALDGYTDTFSVTAAGAFDNYLVGSLGSLTYNLDIFSAGPGSDSSAILLTVPTLFQLGLNDVDGVITPLSSFSPIEAINPDIGLIDLSNLVAGLDVLGGL